MSVAETVIAKRSISWDELTEIAPLPDADSENLKWDSVTAAAGRAARRDVWQSEDQSAERIHRACLEWLKELDPEGGNRPLHGPVAWVHVLARALARDPLIRQPPTLNGVDFALSCIEQWWPEHWAQEDKSDIEEALSMSEVYIEFQYGHFENQSDVTLAKLIWLDHLRKQFPGCPVTTDELRQLKHRRRVLAAGEKYSAGFSGESKSFFDELLVRFADGSLDVPISGNAHDEAVFFRYINFVGIEQVERCRIGAAILHTVAALNSEHSLRRNTAIHPVCGYALVLGTRREGSHNTQIGAAPGLWRLRIEGEQYMINCELWPRPVVMSHNEFGRARGSANAILRDVGISVDSPPGHWKKVWETHGLRDQLLAAAERVDPRIRLEQVLRWVREIASEAPAAHRPPTDGSAVRLADGATVADVRWLVERALADGMIMPHERDGLEREIRRRSMETNRRDAAKRQRKLLVLDPGPVASENPLITTEFSATSKNEEDR